MFYKGVDRIYRVRAWDDFDWLIYGFGTRDAAALPNELSPHLTTLRQIHSATIVDAAGHTGCLGDGDALIDNSANTFLGIKTADCFPILLVDPERRAVAAVHAGWRGTAERIAAETVKAMVRRFGSIPEDLHGAIGPGIGNCCFEVGPEVARKLAGLNERRHINLSEINQRQLIDTGLSPKHIYAAGLCTVCHPEDFFSYRWDHEHAGRMLTFVGIKNEGREKSRALVDHQS